MLFRIPLLLSLLLFTCLAFPQVGHPAKGSWSGSLESTSGQLIRIRLLINAHDGELSGVINPGRKSVKMKSVILSADKWQLTIVADMPDGKLTLTGNLSNLGSWTNRKYRGSYTQGKESGNFDITLN